MQYNKKLVFVDDNGNETETMIESVIEGSTNPLASTEANPGQVYFNKVNKVFFRCMGKSGNDYIWEEIVTQGDVTELKTQTDKLIELPTENLVDIADFTVNSNVTTALDTENNAITVTTASAGTYRCAQTEDTFISQNLVAGRSYRINAKAEVISGSPDIRVAIRGVNGNPEQIALNFKLENGESGFMDFTADEYMKRVSLFVTMSASNNASVTFSELWLKEYDISGKDIEAREEIDDLKEQVQDIYIPTHASGDIATFIVGRSRTNLNGLKVNFSPVQTGTGDPSPDNVRPITGISGVKIVHHGTNEVVVNADTFRQFGSGGSWSADGSITSGSGVSTVGVLVPIKAGVTYQMAMTRVSGGTCYRRWATYSDKPGAFDSVYTKRVLNDSQITTNYRTSMTFTANEGEKYLYFGMYKSNNAQQFKITDLSVRIDGKNTYVPGALDVRDVSFPSEAGTVYGGVLDLTAGTLTVGWGNIESYAGETLPGEWISSMDVYSPEAVPTTGAQVVYALTEPITYEFTPIDATTTCDGINLVWADTGSVDVIYPADLDTLEEQLNQLNQHVNQRAKKESISSTIEISSSTAPRGYSVGELLTYGDDLYIVTQQISEGSTLIPGSNIKKTTISDIIASRVRYSDIAEYYQNEMTDTVTKTRNELTEPALVFLWTTDNHRWSTNAGGVQNFSSMIENMKTLRALVPTDAVVVSGDLTDGDKVTTTTLSRAYDCMAEIRTIGVPYIWAQGNHDTNYYYKGSAEYELSIKECFKAYFTDVNMGGFNADENGTDYYIDYESLDTRVIVLNANNVTAGVTYVYGSTTATWLRNTALNTTKNVIIICHQSPIRKQVYGNSGTGGWSDVVNAINNFINNGGNVMMLSGHSHCDVAFVSPWLSVMEGCQRFSNRAQDDTTSTYQMEGFIDVVRTNARQQYTATEDLWSVCVYKPKSNELSLIRFGAGKDRYFHVTPIAPATLTTKLTGTITWSSSNTAVATVADGVVTGVGAGRCAVLAKDETENYECWIIVVE